VCCNVWQCAAVRSSRMLQCLAVRCSMLQCVAVCCNEESSQSDEVRCHSVLHCGERCWIKPGEVWQCMAACYSALLADVVVCGSVLQCAMLIYVESQSTCCRTNLRLIGMIVCCSVLDQAR